MKTKKITVYKIQALNKYMYIPKLNKWLDINNGNVKLFYSSKNKWFNSEIFLLSAKAFRHHLKNILPKVNGFNIERFTGIKYSNGLYHWNNDIKYFRTNKNGNLDKVYIRKEQ